MSKRQYIYVTGGKGGIGKTVTALAITDYKAVNDTVLLIDTDPTNGDSSATYKGNKEPNIKAIRMTIRAEDSSGQVDSSGLIDTLNLADTDDATTIIVDAPAGDSTLLKDAGNIIVMACKQAGIESVIVWLVDSTDRTPINALNAAWESIKDADKIILVKNLRKGTNFEFFDNSALINTIISAQNVQIIELEKIANRLEEHLKIDRMSFKQMTLDTPIGNRCEAQRYRSEMHNKFKQIDL